LLFSFPSHGLKLPVILVLSTAPRSGLLDLIVVDNPSKLMTKVTPTQTDILLTSAASKRVVVQWNVDDGPVQTLVGCFTIATGHKHDPTHLFAETVAVIHPSPSQITDIGNSSLINDWNDAVQNLQSLAAPAANSVSKPGNPNAVVPKDKPQQ
jgi:hypothetical protein